MSMKKWLCMITGMSLLFFLTGCGNQIQLPDDPIQFETFNNGDGISLLWDNKEYIPYSPLERNSQIGECIGYYDDLYGEKIYVCKLKGESESEWLISTIALKNCNEGEIFRAKE